MRIGINKGAVLQNHQVHKSSCEVLGSLNSCPNLPTEIESSPLSSKDTLGVPSFPESFPNICYEAASTLPVPGA